jgi:hypothetical protein
MTAGPHTIPFLPTYIPPDVDVDAVKADVGDDGVSAPAKDVPGLREVVAEASEKGIDFKVVVIDKNPRIDTPMRDIAMVVGKAYPGSTVLALSPSHAGAYSPAFDRVTLEEAQDLAKTGDSVQSAKNFVGDLTTPEFPWTALTIVLTVGVVAAVAVTRRLQVWARHAAPEKTSANADN